MKNSFKHVLVAGGAGFVGLHLVTELLTDSDVRKVTVLDNQNSSANSDRIASLRNIYGTQFEYVFHDIRDPFETTEKIDEIYNLACPASPPLYQKDLIYTHETCVIGTQNLIKLALKHRARILQASTSEVYGDPTVSVQSEDYRGNVNCVGIRSCYDEGKRFAETMLHDYGVEKDLDYRIARIFNTYGPYMNPEDGRVVSNFIVQALTGQDITIYGTGQQTRSFCFVTDLVDGLIALMDSEEPKLLVNLGNPKEFTMIELANEVLLQTKSTSKIIYTDLPVDDPQQRKPDISRAKTKLNWEPQFNLETGIKMTISYFKGLLRK